MIISASRRTDIPAFYSDWFINRLNEQYVLVRNPMNFHQISNISLSPEVVDCIVFWSKNPRPLLYKRNDLMEYMYYVQFTLNPYGSDIEQHLPPLDERIDTFIALSEQIGKERVIWRYDPVLLNDSYTVCWHIEQFQMLAEQLSPYTETVTFSFIDRYAAIAKSLNRLSIREPSEAEQHALAAAFSAVANNHRLTPGTCAEDIDLSRYQIDHARCIDDRLIARLLGCSLNTVKDKNQRPECGCAASIDLGFYNTCQNGCIYCYANHSQQILSQNLTAYDPLSPLLCSRLSDADKLSNRNVKSQKDSQLNLFSI